MGRKPKYENPQAVVDSFYAAVSDSYNHPATGEDVGEVSGKKKQELLAEEFGISRIKVRKILITTGDLVYRETAEIQSLMKEGLSVTQAAEKMGIAKSTANSLLPHTKGVYKLSEVSAAAERTQLYRGRKEAVKRLRKGIEDGDWSLELWKAITLFQSYPFQTAGRGSKPGVKFRYTVSEPGGNGGRKYIGPEVEGYGNEMWIDGKEKSISRSTVERAMKTALEMGGVVKGPKALNVPGAHSYLYPIFVRFGVIESGSGSLYVVL